MREQLEIGIQAVEKVMEKRCLMVCVDKGAPQTLATLQRRVLSEASTLFGAADPSKMHHVGMLDFSKLGRVSMVEIKEAAEWCKMILNLNDEYSNFWPD